MKVERPDEQQKWWEGHRFYCQCGSLITLEHGDSVEFRVIRGLLFSTTIWLFCCPVCNDTVRFDDRLTDHY